jgi:hypothetical protein
MILLQNVINAIIHAIITPIVPTKTVIFFLYNAIHVKQSMKAVAVMPAKALYNYQ